MLRSFGAGVGEDMTADTVRKAHSGRSHQARAVTLAGALLLAMASSPASGDGALGGFTASATAQAVRTSLDVEGFLVVSSIADGGGPVSQAMVDTEPRSFAALPYPGDTALGGPGLLAAAGGPSLPAYPFYVAASSSAPEQRTSDPSGTYLLAARVGERTAEADARLTASPAGASARDAATGGWTWAGVNVASGKVTATAESVVEGISIADGALRIGLVRSTSVTTYSGNAPSETVGNLVVEGGRAGQLTFAYGPEGLTVASQGIPLPARQAGEALNQALAPAGVQVRVVGADPVTGGGSSDALEVTYRTDLATGGRAIVRHRFGGTTTAVTAGSAAAPDLPAPAAPVDDLGGLAGVSSPTTAPGEPTTAFPAPDVPGPTVPPRSGGGTGTGGGPLAPGPAAAEPIGPGQAIERSPLVSAAPVFEAREVAPVRVAYAVIGGVVAVLFIMSSLWRTRGSLSL